MSMTNSRTGNTISLGKTDLLVPKMGIGTWSWGERLFWGFGRGYTEEDIRASFDINLAAGVNFFDTAEAYGRGNSERLLGKFAFDSGKNVIIATKFMPYPWRLWKGSMHAALKNSLARLKRDHLDLYQIHWPFPPIPIRVWVDGLAEVVESGLVRSVGVSNFSVEQMKIAHSILAKRGIPLASNQVEYNLLNRKIEYNGLLSLCKDLGVSLIAYSPLSQGLLTGKYTPENPPSGVRGMRYRAALLERIQPLINQEREIGREHGNKTPAQVAINWTISKGTLPIPGAKNARQAQENLGALDWKLSEGELNALDKISREIS
jgi:aryl-alcohol dehydrogenase-like predicted oxidoreductase